MHIDIRTNFVREFVEDEFIKIIFVKSEDNNSDGQTWKPMRDIMENTLQIGLMF
jgi:hypothetical protein